MSWNEAYSSTTSLLLLFQQTCARKPCRALATHNCYHWNTPGASKEKWSVWC